MEFEGQYLTYDEYQELGGTLEEMPFNILEFEARKQIDMRTQNRLHNVDTIPNEVKMCMYQLIDRINNYNDSINSATNSNGSISSEQTDGYSISYNQVNATQIESIVNSKQIELTDIIISYLFGLVINGEHIIYCGV